MIKNQTSFIDDKGYNQGFKEGFAQEKRIERRADWIISEMNLVSGKTVLEIGCGTGYMAYCIAQKTNMQVIAFDKCEPFIDQAKKNYQLANLSYNTRDFYKIPGNLTNGFDYIVGNGILHHLYYKLDEALGTLHSLLNREGKILFLEPNIYNPYLASIFRNKILRKWAKLQPDEMAFSKGLIQKKLRETKFKNIEVTYKDFLLPGIPKFLVAPSIAMSNLLEKTPFKYISQSLFINAEKNESL